MKVSWTRYLPSAIRDNLEGRPALQKAVGNTGWLFADNVLRLGAGLLVSVWLTRYLGPERFGLLSYANALVLLFSSVAMLGLDAIVVRNLVRAPSRRDETLGTAFALRFGGGVLAALLALLAIALLRPSDHLAQLLVGISTIGLLFQSFGAFDFWFQSQLQSRYAVYARSGAYLVSCVLKGVLIWFQAPLAAFAAAGVVDIMLGSLGLLLAYRNSGERFRDWRATRAMAAELLRDSWPLIFADIVVLAYMRIDKILLGNLAGNAELGVYCVAALCAEALYFIPVAVGSSLYPGLVQARESGEQLYLERLQHSYNLMAFLGYAVALPVTLTAWWLIPLFFGSDFSRAGTMLVGLVWAGVFVNLSIVRNYFLTANNWTRLHFITDLLACLLNITLNCLLIPRYGGTGAVIASLVTYWFAVQGVCIFFKPLHGTGRMLTRALVYPRIW